jgi:hypothetical protein
MRLLRKFWDDDCGAGLLASELLFLYSVLVLGSVSGMVAMRQALLSELTEAAQSLMSLNQSFSLSGQSNCAASSAGSSASDSTNGIPLVSVPGSGHLTSQSPLD